MKNLENLEKIDAYLDGSLTPDEMQEFETLLNSDTDLKVEFNTIKKIRESIILRSDLALKSKIAKTHTELKEEGFFNNNTKIFNMKNGNFTKWAAGIAALFILVMATLILFPNKGNIDDMLAADLKPNNELALITIDKLEADGFVDINENRKDSLLIAMKAYSDFKFKDAKTLFDQYLVSYPEDKTALFYLGLTQLNLTEYSDAVKTLTPLVKEKDFEFREDVVWNLAICYLSFKNNDGNVAAKNMFDELTKNKDSKYFKAAKGYLNLL